MTSTTPTSTPGQAPQQDPTGEILTLTREQLTPCRSLFDLRGKHVVVTAATGTIASAVVKGLFREGASVAVIARNQEKLDSLWNEISSAGVVHPDTAQKFPPVCSQDLVTTNGLEKCRDFIFQHFGVPDSLLLMLGGNRPESTVGPTANILDLDPDEVRKTVDFNFMQGGVIPLLTFLRRMIPEREEGKRINIVGIGSEAGIATLTRVGGGYGPGKAALANFLNWCAVELPQRCPNIPICVNTVTPGFVLGDQNMHLLREKDGITPTERSVHIMQHTPSGRFCTAEEMVAPVLSLLSDGFEAVNGANLIVDLGFNTKRI